LTAATATTSAGWHTARCTKDRCLCDDDAVLDEEAERLRLDGEFDDEHSEDGEDTEDGVPGVDGFSGGEDEARPHVVGQPKKAAAEYGLYAQCAAHARATDMA
jgi:hypothetical protein